MLNLELNCIVDRPRATKTPTVIPSPPKPTEDTTRAVGHKRKRGAQEDRDDNPFLVDDETAVPPSPKRIRASETSAKPTKPAAARSDSQVTKSRNNATTRTTKKYGAKKDKTSPPACPSTRADAIEIDFDEIPGSHPARVTAPSTSTFAFNTLPPSSPQRSSSPPTVLPVTKPLISGMKGKDGKVTPQKNAQAIAPTKPRPRAMITKKEKPPPPVPEESDSEPPGPPAKTRTTKSTTRAPAGGKKSGKRGARPLPEDLSSDSETPKATEVIKSSKPKRGAKKAAAAVVKNGRRSGNQDEDEAGSAVEDEIQPFSSPPMETRAAAKTRAAGKVVCLFHSLTVYDQFDHVLVHESKFRNDRQRSNEGETSSQVKQVEQGTMAR